jgi:FHA domain/zinc-ribbon domain
MGAATCLNCGAALRPQSRFCPKCATPVAGAAPAIPAPPSAPGMGRGGGYTARPVAPRPPMASPRPGGGFPPRGTFVKDEPKRPGTVLYQDREKGPVLGWLVIMKGKGRGRDFRIEKESLTIGREGSCDVALDDETASRQHARVRRDSERFAVFDLGSANGTFVNRERVYKQDLNDGDVIRVGETLLLFKEAKPGPQWTPAPDSSTDT